MNQPDNSIKLGEGFPTITISLGVPQATGQRYWESIPIEKLKEPTPSVENNDLFTDNYVSDINFSGIEDEDKIELLKKLRKKYGLEGK